MQAATFVFGLAALVLGGELLVRGAVSIARQLHVSPLMIGLTLVGFGTSTPELVTSLQAAAARSPGIAVGNVVGSNTANILLILGLAALIRPLAVVPAAFARDGSMLTLSALFCVGAAMAGTISRVAGVVFLAILIAYVVITYVLERGAASASAELHKAEATVAHRAPGGLLSAAVALVGGLIVTIVGARFMVEAAIELAKSIGVSDTVIGLTVVAVGTSMPELMTSVVASARGQSDVAVGNVVGSNIYNILGILGVTALVNPVTVPESIAGFDVWVMLASTGALFLAVLTGWRVTRLEGGLMLAAYVGYVVYLVDSAL